MKPSRAVALALASPWAATFLIFWLFPLGYSFLMGFTDYRLLVSGWSWVGLSNYLALLLSLIHI